MEFKFSNCVALQTVNPEKARDFYQQVMGIKFDADEDGFAFAKCGALNLFVGSLPNYTGPVLDFVVENIEEARAHLLKNGCEILQWDENRKFLRDPFGLCFNLYPKS
jgi:catechol 2,3-dioxygenase-like lactoylglutathione lyase family enzyme